MGEWLSDLERMARLLLFTVFNLLKSAHDMMKRYKNRSDPEGPLLKSIKTGSHGRAAGLSDCNGKFRCHHRSYEEYPCGQ